MSPSSDFDRTLAAWLDAQAPMHEPDGLTYAVLARTRRMRQLPGWASLERWLPMTVLTRPALSPPLRLVWLLLVGLLTLALATSVAIVGSRLLTSNIPDSGLPATVMIPQGDEAVFALATSGDGAEGEAAGDIYTIKADGSDLRQLTAGPALDSMPVWSPDGTRIAYRQWQDGADSVVVMDAGGGSAMTLATNSQDSEYCVTPWSMSWAPDGSSLIFPTRDGCTGAFDLNIVAADGSSPATPLLEPGSNSLVAAWSPEGTQLAYLGSEGTGDAGLYVADVTPEVALTGNLQGRLIAPDLGPNVARTDPGIDPTPRWSPDGTEVAVVAGPLTGFFILDAEGIYIVKADGTGQRLIAEDAGNPSWSPDGRQLAFHRSVDPSEYFDGRPCTVRTWIVDVDGSDPRRLDELGDGCGGASVWSPDGTRLASVLIASTPDQPDLGFHLGFVRVDGSSPPKILLDGFGSWQPVAAPLPPAPSFAPASPTL